MSKTFKSVIEDSSYRLKVARGFSEEYVFVSVQGGRSQESIAIADKDIPSLMLALGETAGYVPKWDSWSENGTPEHLAHIQWHLAKYAEAQVAQAEETAKLEAEAVELWKAYNGGDIWVDVESVKWSDLTESAQTRALAVARKARELGN